MYLAVRPAVEWPWDGPRVVAVALDPTRTTEGLDALRRAVLGLPADGPPAEAAVNDR